MSDSKKSNLENLCKEFTSDLQGVVSWKWDGFFGAIMAEVNADEIEKVRSILDQHLGSKWDLSNINEAPEIVEVVNDSLGKLREGQTLLASDTEEDACLLCAWWPWGNGEKVSIRIIPTCRRVSDEDIDELKNVFKSWFGL